MKPKILILFLGFLIFNLQSKDFQIINAKNGLNATINLYKDTGCFRVDTEKSFRVETGKKINKDIENEIKALKVSTAFGTSNCISIKDIKGLKLSTDLDLNENIIDEISE